jgi:excisionase family DNA binding protein
VKAKVTDGRYYRGSGLPQYFTVKAVAEALSISPRTVRRWSARGALAVHRVDGVVRISEADLRFFWPSIAKRARASIIVKLNQLLMIYREYS